MPIAKRDPSRSPIGRTVARILRARTSMLRAGAVLAAVTGLSFAATLVPATVGAAADPARVSIANADGTIVDPTGFPAASDAFLTSGACATDPNRADAAVLPDGNYTFLVTTADGSTPLSSDAASNRTFQVVAGRIVSTAGPHTTNARGCATDPTSGGPITIGLAPFAALPKDVAGYRVAVALTSQVQTCAGSGDPTGFGCAGLDVRTAAFTIAGTTASTTHASLDTTGTAAGDDVTDTATVTGTSTGPTGTVAFFVCASATCDHGGTAVGSATVDHGAAAAPAWTAPSAGTWSFRAEYWGDATYAASTASSGQSVAVTGAAPSGSATATPAAPSASATSSAPASATASDGIGSTATPAPTGSAAGASPTAGTTEQPSVPATTSPSATPTPTPTGATATPRPTASHAPATPPPATPTPPSGPIKTGTPPPPPQKTPVPVVTSEPVITGPGGCFVCYAVSPSFFGPGYGQPLSAPPTSLTGLQPNPAAIAAYGPGGVPHFPGINAPATQPPAVGASGGAAPAGGAPAAGAGTGVVPGAGDVEAAAMLVYGPGGSPVPGGLDDMQTLGGGVLGAGLPDASAQATGTITDGSPAAAFPVASQDSSAPSAAASNDAVAAVAGGAGASGGGQGGQGGQAEGAGTIGTPTAAATPSSGALPAIVVGLILVGLLAAAWVLRARRVRTGATTASSAGSHR